MRTWEKQKRKKEIAMAYLHFFFLKRGLKFVPLERHSAVCRNLSGCVSPDLGMEKEFWFGSLIGRGGWQRGIGYVSCRSRARGNPVGAETPRGKCPGQAVTLSRVSVALKKAMGRG